MIRAALSRVPGGKFISFSVYSLSKKLTVGSTQLRHSGCFLFVCLFLSFLLPLFSVCQTFHPAPSTASSSCARSKWEAEGEKWSLVTFGFAVIPLLRAVRMHTNHLRGELKHNRGNECKWGGVNFALDLQMELIRRLDTHAQPAIWKPILPWTPATFFAAKKKGKKIVSYEKMSKRVGFKMTEASDTATR